MVIPGNTSALATIHQKCWKRSHCNVFDSHMYLTVICLYRHVSHFTIFLSRVRMVGVGPYDTCTHQIFNIRISFHVGVYNMKTARVDDPSNLITRVDGLRDRKPS
jgi:hypothetical protein